MAAIRKITTFWQLPAHEKLATGEAVIGLCVARMLVNLVPFRHWRDQIAVEPTTRAAVAEPSAAQRQTARMVMRIIQRAQRNAPVEFVCLPQALCARWMLSRRGVPTQLYLGTRLAAEAEREFHAWLKVGPVMVTGHCDESDYAVLGVQSRV